MSQLAENVLHESPDGLDEGGETGQRQLRNIFTVFIYYVYVNVNFSYSAISFGDYRNNRV